jgi:hypothetical protein
VRVGILSNEPNSEALSYSKRSYKALPIPRLGYAGEVCIHFGEEAFLFPLAEK